MLHSINCFPIQKWQLAFLSNIVNPLFHVVWQSQKKETFCPLHRVSPSSWNKFLNNFNRRRIFWIQVSELVIFLFSKTLWFSETSWTTASGKNGSFFTFETVLGRLTDSSRRCRFFSPWIKLCYSLPKFEIIRNVLQLRTYNRRTVWWNNQIINVLNLAKPAYLLDYQ